MKSKSQLLQEKIANYLEAIYWTLFMIGLTLIWKPLGILFLLAWVLGTFKEKGIGAYEKM